MSAMSPLSALEADIDKYWLLNFQNMTAVDILARCSTPMKREAKQGEPLFRLSNLTRAYAQMRFDDKRTDAIASDL
jgi:hypothetical protein